MLSRCYTFLKIWQMEVKDRLEAVMGKVTLSRRCSLLLLCGCPRCAANLNWQTQSEEMLCNSISFQCRKSGVILTGMTQRIWLDSNRLIYTFSILFICQIWRCCGHMSLIRQDAWKKLCWPKYYKYLSYKYQILQHKWNEYEWNLQNENVFLRTSHFTFLSVTGIPWKYKIQDVGYTIIKKDWINMFLCYCLLKLIMIKHNHYNLTAEMLWNNCILFHNWPELID